MEQHKISLSCNQIIPNLSMLYPISCRQWLLDASIYHIYQPHCNMIARHRNQSCQCQIPVPSQEDERMADFDVHLA
jgi:hypothetical protein